MAEPLILSSMEPCFLSLSRYMRIDAARTHDRQHAAVSKIRLSTRILGSKWTPSILKTVMRGFRRKSMVKQAKNCKSFVTLSELDAYFFVIQEVIR